jgi:hypothetical protein
MLTLIEPRAVTTASRIEAGPTDRRGMIYLNNERADVIFSWVWLGFDPFRRCCVIGGELCCWPPLSDKVVHATIRYNFHCSISTSGGVVEVPRYLCTSAEYDYISALSQV